MGFDKNDPTPVVQFSKRTTKVNLSMILAVLAFFVIAGAAILWIHERYGH
jgi:hypothetical protein